MKLGIFGGTFNPPHIAHLIGAELVRDEFHIDRILFIPSYIPPHKQKPDIPVVARLDMLNIAIEGNPCFLLVDNEIKRKEVSYTIDTIKEIMAQYGGENSLHLIIGADQAKEFRDWKEPDTLIGMFESIIIMTRPGYSRDEIDRGLRGKTKIFEMNIDISSTMIREFVRRGKSIKYLVPEGVREYIIENKLYKEKY